MIPNIFSLMAIEYHKAILFYYDLLTLWNVSLIKI